jgi:hypothetical protein
MLADMGGPLFFRLDRSEVRRRGVREVMTEAYAKIKVERAAGWVNVENSPCAMALMDRACLWFW